MKNFYTVLIIIFISANINSHAQENFTLVHFVTEDQANIEAAYFKAPDNKKAIVFAHGAVFNKESWYFLAEKLQAKGISGLSIDFRGYGNSKQGKTEEKYYDVLGAIHFLKGEGYTEIYLMGGSMGGFATLKAINEKPDDSIKKVLIMAAHGSPVDNISISKFFIVSRGDGLFQRVESTYKNSSDPKKIKIYEGSAHAQHMFKEDYREELIDMIVQFFCSLE